MNNEKLYRVRKVCDEKPSEYKRAYAALLIISNSSNVEVSHMATLMWPNNVFSEKEIKKEALDLLASLFFELLHILPEDGLCSLSKSRDKRFHLYQEGYGSRNEITLSLAEQRRQLEEE